MSSKTITTPWRDLTLFDLLRHSHIIESASNTRCDIVAAPWWHLYLFIVIIIMHNMVCKLVLINFYTTALPYAEKYASYETKSFASGSVAWSTWQQPLNYRIVWCQCHFSKRVASGSNPLFLFGFAKTRQ